VQNTEVAGVGAGSKRTYQELDGTYREEEYWETENYTDYENVEVPKIETFYESQDSPCHCYNCGCRKCKPVNSNLNSLEYFLFKVFSRSLIFLKFSCIFVPFLLFSGVGFLFGRYCQNWYIAYLISGESSSVSIIGYVVGVISIVFLMTVLYCKKRRRCCFKSYYQKIRDPED
jgi:hypothetical protein